MRAARPRDQPRLALGSVSREELVQPAAVHPVHPCELADRPTLAQMCLDEKPPGIHWETPSPGVSDVLTHPAPRCRVSPELGHHPGYRMSFPRDLGCAAPDLPDLPDLH